MTRELLEHPAGQNPAGRGIEAESGGRVLDMRRDGERTCGVVPAPPLGQKACSGRATKMHGSSSSHVGK